MKNQQGFTLIELIVVIVILGILAATALPKFINLKGDAETATAAGVAGAIASSASIQYGANQISSVAYPYSAASACAGSYLQGGIDASCSAVGTTSCVVTCGSGTKTVTLP